MLDLSLISRQRKALMGIAILFIMLYHSAVIFRIPIFRLFFLNGDIGVEMFAVLSGIGIFYSLDKNSTLSFYKKRLVRIVPSFMIVAIPYSLFLVLCKGASWKYFVSLVCGIAPLLGDYTFWFVSFILLCYLFSPLLFPFFRGRKTYGLFAIASFVSAKLLMWLFPSQLEPLMWIFRFSDFIFGMEIASSIFDVGFHNDFLSKRVISSVIALMIIFGALVFVRDLSYEVRYFTYFIVSIPLLISLASVVEHCQWIKKVFSFLGSFTLEIYLLHEHICIPIIQSLCMPIWMTCLLSMALAVALAILVSNVRNVCIKILT